MGFDANEKNLAIAQLKKVIGDAKESAGIADLGEVDTDMTALETAYGTDPATVTATNIQALRDKIGNLSFAAPTSLTALWSEVQSEADAGN
jgi:hypothetical protein